MTSTTVKEAIERVNSAIAADKTFSLGDIQDIITAAQEAEAFKNVRYENGEGVRMIAAINDQLRARIAILETALSGKTFSHTDLEIELMKRVEELEKQRLVEVTEEEYTQHLMDERGLQKRYVPSGEFISKRYPFGLKIVGGG